MQRVQSGNGRPFGAERKPLSKKMRFDVFKRDSFTCQYCGSNPPAVVLEVDHIHPVSKGGRNVVDNLITACFDCNRGKSAGLLTLIPQSIADKAEIIAEKMAQMKAFEKMVRAKRKGEESSIDEVEDVFNSYFDGYHFNPRFRESVRLFLQHINVFDLMDAMNRACSKIGRRDDSIKYFCGICWKIIKERKNG